MRRGVRRRDEDRKDRPPPTPEVARERALACAFRSLARGPRTRAEIAATLARRGHGAEATASTLARLDELGYLDDALVAGAVARGAERKQLGSRRVALTLGRRGVARDVVADTARDSATTDLARARAFLARRCPGGVPSDRLGRQKVARQLASRGFPGDVVRKALGIDFDVDDDASSGDDA
jgi:regulatory protein